MEVPGGTWLCLKMWGFHIGPPEQERTLKINPMKTIVTREEFSECGITAQIQLPAPFITPLGFSVFLFEVRIMSLKSWCYCEGTCMVEVLNISHCGCCDVTGVESIGFPCQRDICMQASGSTSL